MPFRALRFNPHRIPDIAEVVAPPYDVISPEDRAALLARNPYNIISIELPVGGADRYTRAAAQMRQWQTEEILQYDNNPGLYILEEHFTVDGRQFVRHGVLATVTVTPWSNGEVLPHEFTLPGPKQDRLDLLRACQANISPIFLLFDDPDNQVQNILRKATAGDPLQHIALAPGSVPHAADVSRLWAITDEGQVARLLKLFAARQAYIADGHHRYETALTYRQEQAARTHGGSGPWDRALMFLVAVNDPGLAVLPIHRIIRNISSSWLAYFHARLAELFELIPLDTRSTPDLTSTLDQTADGSFLLIERDALHLLRPRRDLAPLLPYDHSPAWRSLDVSALHTLVLEPMLGLGEREVEGEGFLTYTRSAQEALDAVHTDQAQLAFLLKPTRPEQLCAIARAHDRMPQKSTFFFPKPVTGTLIYDHQAAMT
ncbi:MAG: DUF1015 domain-containing protein [Chloroflexi bacterium]|nr:DUF1015 domain-containing protein [Chloroflexota bacterium]